MSSRPRLVRACLVLLAVQILLVGAFVVVTQRQANAIPSAPNPDDWNLPVPDQGLTIETGIARADEVARSWRQDAQLAFVSMQVDWSPDAPPAVVTSVPPFGWLRFIYVSPIDGGESEHAALGMLFERVSGALVQTGVTSWDAGMPDRALMDGVVVSDQTAVLAAEISGGTIYRAACPDRRSQTGVSLSADAISGQPTWNLVYRERGAGGEATKRVTVNAVDGTVTDVRRGAITCSA